jgi:hypothetical protein
LKEKIMEKTQVNEEKNLSSDAGLVSASRSGETPYENHAALDHSFSRYSPNGFDLIEECDDCPMRFLRSPTCIYPITLRPMTIKERESPNRSMALDGLDRVIALKRAEAALAEGEA